MFHVAILNRLPSVRNRDGSVERKPLPEPDRPGRWKLIQASGNEMTVRVIERNGALYVVRGGWFAVARPVDHFEGSWLLED